MTQDIVNVSVAMEQTAEVGMTVDSIMQQKIEIISHLCADNKEKKLLIKELMITSYITGFFAGINQTHRDMEKTQSN